MPIYTASNLRSFHKLPIPLVGELGELSQSSPSLVRFLSRENAVYHSSALGAHEHFGATMKAYVRLIFRALGKRGTCETCGSCEEEDPSSNPSLLLIFQSSQSGQRTPKYFPDN